MSSTNQGEVLIGAELDNRVTIRRCSANGPELWYDTEIEVRCDGWHGKFDASFMQGELSGFGREVEKLYRSLVGEAALEPLEPNLTLSFRGDGKGHIAVSGVARTQFHTGTELVFMLLLDQTQLPAIATALADIDPNL